MSYLLNVLKIYLNLSGIVLLLCFRKRVHPFSAPILAIAGIFVIIFPFTLLGAGRMAYRIVQILNALSWLVSLLMLFLSKYRNKAHSFREILPAFLVFSIGFLVIGCLSRTWYLHGWDEFDNYYSTALSLFGQGKKAVINTGHPEYPYAVGIISAYFCYVSEFNEHILYIAHILIFYASCMYLGSCFKRPVFWSLFFYGEVLLLCHLFPTWNEELVSLYQDALIGVLFAVTAAEAWRSDKTLTLASILTKSVLFSFFIFVKDMPAMLFIAVFLILMLRQQSIGAYQSVSGFLKTVFVGFLSVLPYGIWWVYKKINGIARSHNFSASVLRQISSIFNGSESEYAEAWNRFVKVVFTDPFGNTGISLYIIILLFLLLYFMVLYFHRDRLYFRSGMVITAIGIIYLLVCGYAYIFVLGSFWSEYFIEFGRFVSCYMIGWLLFETLRLAEQMFSEKSASEKKFCAWVFILLVFAICVKTPVIKIFEQRSYLKTRDCIAWKNIRHFYADDVPSMDLSGKLAVLSDSGLTPFQMRAVLVNDIQYPIDVVFLNDQEKYRKASIEDVKLWLEQEDARYVYVDDRTTDLLDRCSELFTGVSQVRSGYQLFEKGQDGLYYRIGKNVIEETTDGME